MDPIADHRLGQSAGRRMKKISRPPDTMPARLRVAELYKANPGRSTRQAADDLGVSQSEVQRARKSGEPSGSPDTTVTGRDGKRYSARLKRREAAPDDPLADARLLLAELEAKRRGDD